MAEQADNAAHVSRVQDEILVDAASAEKDEKGRVMAEKINGRTLEDAELVIYRYGGALQLSLSEISLAIDDTRREYAAQWTEEDIAARRDVGLPIYKQKASA